MQLAAKFAAIWVTLDERGASRDQIERLEGICDRVGRSTENLDKLVLTGFSNNPLGSVAEFEDTASRFADEGFTDLVVHWPREGEPFPGDHSVLERIAADVLQPATGEAG